VQFLSFQSRNLWQLAHERGLEIHKIGAISVSYQSHLRIKGLNLRKYEVRGRSLSFVFAQIFCRMPFLRPCQCSRRARRLLSEAGGNEVRQVKHGRTWSFAIRVYGNSESAVPGSDACACV
jgi:hypothetical protein